MKPVDPGAEWLRLADHYRKMSDRELLSLARQSSNLTEEARQVLADQMSIRALKLLPEAPRVSVARKPDPNSPYAEDRELVGLCRVWSLRDALQLKYLLDVAGIPFYLGKDRLADPDLSALNYAEGVPVAVMRIGYPWAWMALRNYEPADEPQGEQIDWHEIPVRCPKCRSTDTVFERLTPQANSPTDCESSNFEWTCDSCGHHWADDGVLKEM